MYNMRPILVTSTSCQVKFAKLRPLWKRLESSIILLTHPNIHSTYYVLLYFPRLSGANTYKKASFFLFTLYERAEGKFFFVRIVVYKHRWTHNIHKMNICEKLWLIRGPSLALEWHCRGAAARQLRWRGVWRQHTPFFVCVLTFLSFRIYIISYSIV